MTYPNSNESLIDAINEHKSAISTWSTKYDDRLRELQEQIDHVDVVLQRRHLGAVEDRGPVEAETKAFCTFLRKGDTTELKGLSVGSDPDGGYTVTPVMSGRIVEKLFETSPMRQIAAIETIDSDTLEMLVDKDEAAAAWVGETQSRQETDSPEWAKVSIPIHEIYAAPKATQKLLDDSSVNIEDWLTGKVANKFSRSENTAFVNGDGVGKPRGFLTYPTDTADDDARTWGEVQYVPSGAAGAFAGSDPSDALIDLVGKMNPAYLPNSWWVMARTTLVEVRKFKSSTGDYLWRPGIERGQPDTLLGFPILLAEDMPAIAADSLSIAFGDFRTAYQIVDRHGMRVLRDPYVDKPHTVFYTYKRVGGDVVHFDAIKLMKFSAT